MYMCVIIYEKGYRGVILVVTSDGKEEKWVSVPTGEGNNTPHTDRQTDRQTHTHTHKHKHAHTHKYTNKHCSTDTLSLGAKSSISI